MDWGERHAIDPLDDFYRTQPEFSKFRDPAVRFQNATGERLPYEAATFDLIILYVVRGEGNTNGQKSNGFLEARMMMFSGAAVLNSTS